LGAIIDLSIDADLVRVWPRRVPAASSGGAICVDDAMAETERQSRLDARVVHPGKGRNRKYVLAITERQA
jgi:hypothetical protein